MTHENTSAGATRTPRLRIGGWARWLVAGLVALITMALASAWLVFPYFFEGDAILQSVGGRIQDDRAAARASLSQRLTRVAPGPGEAEIEVLFATPEYFQAAGNPRTRAAYAPDEYLIFIINETTHTRDLPQQLPEASLEVNGRTYAPVDAEGPIEVAHHRSTTVRFPRFDAAGKPILPATGTATLTLASDWDAGATPRAASWMLPVDVDDAIGASSPVMLMALSAGLLSAVLTPCLLQLIVVYLVTLTGHSVQHIRESGGVSPEVRRKMLVIAGIFILGFTAFYTLAGAVMGYAGKTAQIVFSDYSREASIGAGVLVILMGLLMGIKGRAPVVCRLPAPALSRRLDRNGYVSSAILAFGFSLGCMTCFSGAIMATLLIYVGALGSATTGAAILFVFSLGVAVPFLAAAVFLSRAASVTTWFARYTPQLSLFSTIVIVAFGLVLVTDNFHALSDAIYPYLGLN